AVPDLAARLGDSDRNVRRAATAALATTLVPGAANEQTVAALVPLLGDPDPDLGLLAAEALGRCGPLARAAEPGLRKLLDSGDPDARLAALHALGQIDPHDDELIAADIAALNAPDDIKRQHAMTAIAAFGAAAVPRLTSALSGPEQGATAAAETLGRIGPAAAAAVPALSRLLDDPRRYVRRCAVRALGQIGPPAADAVPALLALLQDNTRIERDEDRREIAQALGGIGPAAAPAVPTLATLVRNGGEVGADAAKALGGIGPAAAPAIPDLSLALHSWPFYRDTLPIVLGKIGSEQGVPALVDALGESSLAMNCAALAALTLIGPKAIPPLETALGAVPTLDSADDANRRYKIQAAIKHLRTGDPEPVECRTIFAELRLR
ncbi:MAG: HEAT repeat domain-containing protein, partial [Gaiellaceae bacterium]